MLSASQAFLLNLCIFKCTTINSPLATSVTGQIKDILTMGLGLLLFQDVSYHPVNVLGLLVGFAGGAAYSAVSFQEQRARDAAKRARCVVVPIVATLQTFPSGRGRWLIMRPSGSKLCECGVFNTASMCTLSLPRLISVSPMAPYDPSGCRVVHVIYTSVWQSSN